jgi:hypothetical protein
MNHDIKNHHYVPQWYQKQFKPDSVSKVYYYEKICRRKSKFQKLLRPIKYCFNEKHLYTLKINLEEINSIEKLFFGKIDDRGKKAIFSLINRSEYKYDLENFLDNLLEYICMQIFRTPKGLQKLNLYFGLNELDKNILLLLMTKQTRSWGTIWVEGIWEILRIKNDQDYFMVSDNPVTIYNRSCYPASKFCNSHNDPEINWNATQTIFPLNGKTLLIFTNRDINNNSSNKDRKYRKNPNPSPHFSPIEFLSVI